MRILGRLIVFLIVAACLTAIALPLHSKIWDAWRDGKLDARIAGSIPSVAYIVPTDEWLEFSVAGYDGVLRIISNVNVSPDYMESPDTLWQYALRYQIVDTNNRVLEEKDYHHRARLSVLEDDQRRRYTSTFYLDQDQVPTAGRVLRLNLKGMQSVERIRLRAKYSDPTIHSIIARLHQYQPISREALRHEWKRLSRRQRASIGKASIYGSGLLRRTEINNLLKRRWRPQGPVGIQDIDYQRRRIYSLEQRVGAPVDDFIVPNGLYVSSQVNGVIGIPDPGGRLILEVANADAAVASGRNIFVQWFGRSQNEQRTLSFPVDSDSMSAQVRPGVLQIRSYTPVVVRAYLDFGDGLVEITPSPNSLRLYTVNAGQPVEFPLSHVAQQPTPFRLDLRLPLIEGVETAHVDYTMLNESGSIVESGRLAVQPQPSAYDWLRNYQPPSDISEPSRYYFNVEASVHRIHLTSTSPVLAAAYTRPDDLPHRIHFPGDYRTGVPNENRQPTWFVLRPLQHDQLRKSFRSFLLGVQPRPPQVNPEIVAGRYKWESYRPDGLWRGRYLLNSRDQLSAVREQARGVTYRNLTPGKAIELDMRGRPGDRQVAPSLLYVREQNSPQKISLRIDGRTVYSDTVTGTRGLIRLPPLKVGKHNVSLSASEGGQWLINYAGAGLRSYNLRLAHQINNKSLQFIYEKQKAESEVLSVQIQTGDDALLSALRLRVKIYGERRPGGPFQAWTLTEREFAITPDVTESTIVLGTRNETLHQSATLFVPIGDDFAPGRYRIEIEKLKGPASYMTLYRIMPGAYSEYSFFTESVLDGV